MKSLAFLAFLLVSPSLFFGPIGLLLSLSRKVNGSKVGRVVVLIFSILAFLSGAFLIVGAPGSEAVPLGLIGVITSILSTVRIYRRRD